MASYTSPVLAIYTATVTLTGTQILGYGALGTGFIDGSTTPTPVTFYATSSAVAPNNDVQWAISANCTENFGQPANLGAAVTFYFPVDPAHTIPYTPVAFTPQATFVSTQPIPSTTRTATATTASQPPGASPSSSVSPSQATATTTGTPIPVSSPAKKSYSAGELAGAAVGCALAGVLIACLLLGLCLRRRATGRHRTIRNVEKQAPLLPGHGEAVYVAGIGADRWEKNLPQPDSDNTIRGMTSSTLDQIAMHVENFYCSKRGIDLSTEQQFSLEAIDSSRFPEPISTLLQRSYRTEDLIKHYMSSYIISMISFEDDGAVGNFLPRLFRRQWQPFLREAEVSVEAYSQWRVLTAYLRQRSGDEHAYIAERNAAIDTAARHLCRALEPWAKNETDNRFQNVVSIMKRASELGILLFSQRSRFEWRWTSDPRMGPAVSNSVSEMVILPGLYKTTDQNSVPLATPLSVVEPIVVAFERL